MFGPFDHACLLPHARKSTCSQLLVLKLEKGEAVPGVRKELGITSYLRNGVESFYTANNQIVIR